MERSALLNPRWITSRNFDLAFYIGACLSSYLLIFLHVGFAISALMLYWLWIMVVDGPHVFATISRTYLDSEERVNRRALLLGSLSWFLLGPAMVLISIGIRNKLPFFIFLLFAQLWAYWHVVRQHYGFMVLYQKKNGEAAGKQNVLDYYTFYILMLAPFLSFILRHPQARMLFGLSQSPGIYERWFLILLHAFIGATLIHYLIKTFVRPSINLPKNIFLAACVPLHLLIFLHPYISTHVDLRMFAVFVTFYHNIQYQGIVWFYNRNRYSGKTGSERFGFASTVSRNFFTYYACGLVFTILYRYSNWFFAGTQVPFGSGPNAISQLSIAGLFTVSDLAIGFWWGFAFNHYYLDQKIWRVSKDRQLNNDLRLAASPV